MNREVYRFGPFSLDPKAKVLFQEGRPVHLARKAVETLLVLVENAGKVMTREEIIAAVWTDRVVGEANLTQNIAVIRRALGATAGQPGYIETFPGRGYRLEGPVTRQGILASEPLPETGRRSSAASQLSSTRLRTLLPWIAVAVVLLTAMALLAAWRVRKMSYVAAETGFSVTPITRMPGKEYQPAVSPDGSLVAFVWAREESGNPGIWVKRLDEQGQRRISGSEAHCSSPTWSPDSRELAFLQIGRDATEVVIASTDGQQRRVVARLEPPHYGYDGRLLDWSPDGRFLAVSFLPAPNRPLGLMLISTDGKLRRILTRPEKAAIGDVNPRFSPDGEAITFLRATQRTIQEVFAVPAQGGQARQITAQGRQISDHDWTRSGKEILIAGERNGEFRLWKMSWGENPDHMTRIGIYGEFPIQFSVARRAGVLVYSSLQQDRNIWRLNLNGQVWTRLIASSAQDASPQFSPSGDEICFRSDRSGEEQLWVAAADGSSPVQVTSGPLRPSVGRWSPDGNSIVFNDPATQNLYLAVRHEGNRWQVRQLGVRGIHPVFSPDGAWIYYGGASQIGRVRPDGSEPVPVLNFGGLSLGISADGDFLYFVRELNETALWRASLTTKQAEKVLEGLVQGCTSCWALAPNGVYYLGTRGGWDRQTLFLHNFRTGRSEPVIDYPEPLWPLGSGPFSLSPDGGNLLCVRVDPSNSDVLYVAPFE